jgi:hypothetical protein
MFSCPGRVSKKGVGGFSRACSNRIEEVKDCSLRVQMGNTDWENRLTTTLMKTLFSLALIAALAFMVGCKPADSTTTPPAGTNAAAPAAK